MREGSKRRFLAVCFLTVFLVPWSQAEPQSGVPSSAKELPGVIRAPRDAGTGSEDYEGGFGLAMDAAWPFLAVTERGTDRLNSGRLHLFVIPETNGIEQNLTLIDTFEFPAPILQQWSGSVVSLTTTVPGDNGHGSYDGVVGHVVWTTSNILHRYRIFEGEEGEWEVTPYDAVFISGLCDELTASICDIPPRCLSFNGFEFLYGGGDDRNVYEDVLPNSGPVAPPLRDTAETWPDDGFGQSCVMLKSSDSFIGIPEADTGELQKRGAVEQWEARSPETLVRTIEQSNSERTFFGDGMAGSKGNETVIVVSASDTVPALHVFNQASEDLAHTEIGHLSDPLNSDEAFAQNLAVEVYREQAGGPGDVVIGAGTSRVSTDNTGFLSLYVRRNVDDLGNSPPRLLDHFYAPDAVVGDNFGSSVAMTINPSNGDVWLFGGAPLWDGETSSAVDEGIVWFTVFDGEDLRATNFWLYAGLAGGALVLVGVGAFAFVKMRSRPENGDAENGKGGKGGKGGKKKSKDPKKRAPPGSRASELDADASAITDFDHSGARGSARTLMSETSTGSRGSKRRGGGSAGSRRSKGSNRGSKGSQRSKGSDRSKRSNRSKGSNRR